VKRKIWIFCAGLLFFAGLALALAEEEGVILRYKYKPGQEVIYEFKENFKEIYVVQTEEGQKRHTEDVETKGWWRDFVLSVSDEGIIEMVFYQDEKVVMCKFDDKQQPVPGDVVARLFWQKFDKRGQAVLEKEGRFEDYFEQDEIIELPDEPIEVGDTWKSGFEDDYVAYEVLARERIGTDECFKIKGVGHHKPVKDIPFTSLKDEMVIWFALDKGYIIKMEITQASESRLKEISLNYEGKMELILLEERSFDEAEIASRLSQLEKLYAIQDAIEAVEFDQAESEIKAFTTEFPDSPYREVAATQGRQVEAARQMAAMARSLVGQPAPAFELEDFEGKIVNLADFKGKVVFLDFWATWCEPCVDVIPSIQALYEKYKDKGLVVIGMNVDDDQEEAKRFAKEKELTYIHLFAGEVDDVYAVTSIPAYFIIDKEAVVRYQKSDFYPDLEKEWEKEIEKLLEAQGGE